MAQNDSRTTLQKQLDHPRKRTGTLNLVAIKPGSDSLRKCSCGVYWSEPGRLPVVSALLSVAPPPPAAPTPNDDSTPDPDTASGPKTGPCETATLSDIAVLLSVNPPAWFGPVIFKLDLFDARV